MNKKKQYPINWNLISVCATVIVIVLGIALGYPQKELSLLQTELRLAEKEKKELEKELDPEWHNRLNQLSAHYEYILKRKDDTIKFSNEKIDSLRKEFSIVQKNDRDQITLSEVQAKKIVIALMKSKTQDSLIYINEQQIKNYKAIDDNLNEIIQLKDKYIEYLIEFNSQKRVYGIISLVLAMLIILLILYGKIRSRKKNI